MSKMPETVSDVDAEKYWHFSVLDLIIQEYECQNKFSTGFSLLMYHAFYLKAANSDTVYSKCMVWLHIYPDNIKENSQ